MHNLDYVLYSTQVCDINKLLKMLCVHIHIIDQAKSTCTYTVNMEFLDNKHTHARYLIMQFRKRAFM